MKAESQWPKGVSNYLLVKATLPQASHDDAHLTSPESLFLPTFTQAITNKKNYFDRKFDVDISEQRCQPSLTKCVFDRQCIIISGQSINHEIKTKKWQQL